MHAPAVLQALFWLWQFSHVAPPRPHRVAVLPPRQMPLSQHPLQFEHSDEAPPPAFPPVPPLVPPPPPPAAPPPVVAVPVQRPA